VISFVFNHSSLRHFAGVSLLAALLLLNCSKILLPDQNTGFDPQLNCIFILRIALTPTKPRDLYEQTGVIQVLLVCDEQQVGHSLGEKSS